MLKKIWKFLDGFFPLRLILAQFKYNLIICIYWFVLFGIAAGSMASNYGVPYLFLSPEYDGRVSWLSFLFMGIGFGGFTVAFNIYSYKIMGKVYPFISTLSRPFTKFIINNSLVPVIFCLFYMVKFSVFQRKEELASLGDIFLFNLAFVGGFLFFLLVSFLYFFPTNRDFYKITGGVRTNLEEEPIGSYFHKQSQWKPIKTQNKKRYIYFNSLISIRVSRPIEHYDRTMLDKVFTQNYLNATLFEIVTIIAFFFLGFFKELPIFQFPAGMSIILLLTVILMLFSILVSWFRNWAYPFIIVLVIGLNYMSKQSSIFRYNSYVYGMNYESDSLKNYSWRSIRKINDDSLCNAQTQKNAELILANWKEKSNEKKPKLIITMTSGGGLRSAMWVFETMNHLDSITDQKYTTQSHMITGASGGMLGAAYYRSLQLEKQITPNFKWDSDLFSQNISADLLNTLSISASVNDLFLRVSKFKYKNHKYSKDRGYAFEYQLHKNTDNIFEHPLSFYEPYEKSAQIPLMIFSPTIVNDGRRLLISSQPLNFLAHRVGLPRMIDSYENVDIHSFFEGNSVGDIRFSTILRMNATFPFVLPMTTLPTTPEVEVMDAGIRDNYGGKVTLEYLFKLKEWIAENTSGVIIVQIRDTKKLLADEHTPRFSLLDKLMVPFTVIVRNFMKTQDYDIDEMVELLGDNMGFPIDFVSFDLKEEESTRISLSWHLTKNEKKFIKSAIYSKNNQLGFEHFLKVLNK